MEKQLRENGDKLSAEDKNTVQSEIDAFKKVREGGKADEIKNAMEGFTQKVYADLWQAVSAAGRRGPGSA